MHIDLGKYLVHIYGAHFLRRPTMSATTCDTRANNRNISHIEISERFTSFMSAHTHNTREAKNCSTTHNCTRQCRDVKIMMPSLRVVREEMLSHLRIAVMWFRTSKTFHHRQISVRAHTHLLRYLITRMYWFWCAWFLEYSSECESLWLNHGVCVCVWLHWACYLSLYLRWAGSYLIAIIFSVNVQRVLIISIRNNGIIFV